MDRRPEWARERISHERPGLFTPAAHYRRIYFTHPAAPGLYESEEAVLDDLRAWLEMYDAINHDMEPFDAFETSRDVRSRDYCQGCVTILQAEAEAHPDRLLPRGPESALWPCARGLADEPEPFSALVDVIRDADAAEDLRTRDDLCPHAQ